MDCFVCWSVTCYFEFGSPNIVLEVLCFFLLVKITAMLPRATYEGVELLSDSLQGSPFVHAFDAGLGIPLLILFGLLGADQALLV